MNYFSASFIINYHLLQFCTVCTIKDIIFSLDESLANWTKCLNKGNTNGNLLNWENLDLMVDNSTIEVGNITFEDICSPDHEKIVILPGKKKFYDNKFACERFRSKVHIFNSSVHDLFPKLDLSSIQPPHLWTGFQLRKEPNFYTALSDNKVEIDLNKTQLVWMDDEPNGGINEQCIGIKLEKANNTLIQDFPCSRRFYPVCNTIAQTTFTIQYSKGDTYAQTLFGLNPKFVAYYGDLKPYDFQLKGYNGQSIVRQENTWHLKDVDGKSILQLNSDDAPIGLQNWTSYDNSKQELLNINACNQTEFGCYDGICLPKQARCDQVPECALAEDEKNCHLISALAGYNSLVPLADDSANVDISIEITLQELLQISQKDSTFTVKFELLLNWSDDRLQFRNLQAKANVLSYKEWHQIWIPNLALKDTKHYIETASSFMETKSNVYVQVDSVDEFTCAYENNHNNYFYNGGNVTIFKTNQYTIDFICRFNFLYYPFDTQTCDIIIQFVCSKANQLNPKLKVHNNMSEYETYSIFLANSSIIFDNDIPHGNISLNFKRNILPIALNTYLPTFLLTVINQATNYFKVM